MSAASTGKIVVAILRSDEEIGGDGDGLVGVRIYQANGVPRGAERTYLTYQVVAFSADTDLNGTVNGYTASIHCEIVGDEYEDVEAVLLRFPVAFQLAQGATFAGKKVTGAEATESGDEITGPVDVNGGTAFVGTAEVNIYYEV